MAQTFTCRQNHSWQSNDKPARCPVCGAAPTAVAPSDISILSRTEPQSFSRAEPEQPPTIMAETSQAVSNQDDQDRTLAPALPLGSLAVGRTINATYEILGELGRGGMGVVYKARQLRPNRLVALKMILAGSHAGPEQLARFRAEAELLAPLQHPNIIQVYEVGELDGHPYFSLEYVDGGSLAQKLAGQPLPARQAAELVETLARAMHFAHLRGIVHRDLKPANILLVSGGVVSGEGSKGNVHLAATHHSPLTTHQPKITDFGLAKNLDSDSAQTKTGAILGTPSYISPEQASGKKEIGPATDVYALGAILYELLTGRPPFRGESSMDTMLQVMTDEPVPPRRLQPKVPLDLETICLKCLQKTPARRYGNAEALADDLKRFLNNEPIQARPIGVVQRAVKWARRRPALAALMMVGAVAAISLLAISLYYNAALAVANRKEQDRSRELSVQKDNAEKSERRARDEEKNARGALKVAEEQRRIAQDSLRLSQRSLYAFQLIQASGLAERDPRRALQLLDDPARCPPELRDFTWRYLHHLSSRERATLRGAKSPIACLALSSDGRTLASAAQDGSVTLWDLDGKQSGRQMKTRHVGPVVALAFAPDGDTLATGGFDRTIRLHNVATGVEAGVLEGHGEGVRAVAFAPDGKTLASGSHDRTVILWDVPARKSRTTLSGHQGAVCAVAFSADGQVVASGSADRTVRVWDAGTGKELGPPLEGHKDVVTGVAFAPTGRLLASSSLDKTVKLWQPAQKTPLATLRGHLDAVHAVAFAPSGLAVASGSEDGTVRLWDPATGEPRTLLAGHAKGVTCLAFARSGGVLATGSSDQAIKLWELRPRSQRKAAPLDLGGEPAKDAVSAWSSDGRTLALVRHPIKQLRLWDLVDDKDRVFLQQGLTLAFDCLALSPDGKRLAGAADDQLVHLYDMDKGREHAPLKGHKGRIRCLAFSPDSKLLATGGADQTVRVWDTATGKPVGAARTLGDPVRCLAFAPNGRILATGDKQSVRFWEPTTGRLVADLGPASAGVRLLAFAPDGQTLAVATEGAVRLWDVPQQRQRIMLKGFTGTVTALAFARDSQTLATGHNDWNIMLWDAQTGQERATLTGHQDRIYTLSFTADSKALISVSDDGVARRWPAPPPN